MFVSFLLFFELAFQKPPQHIAGPSKRNNWRIWTSHPNHYFLSSISRLAFIASDILATNYTIINVTIDIPRCYSQHSSHQLHLQRRHHQPSVTIYTNSDSSSNPRQVNHSQRTVHGLFQFIFASIYPARNSFPNFSLSKPSQLLAFCHLVIFFSSYSKNHLDVSSVQRLYTYVLFQYPYFFARSFPNFIYYWPLWGSHQREFKLIYGITSGIN